MCTCVDAGQFPIVVCGAFRIKVHVIDIQLDKKSYAKGVDSP